MSKTCECGGEVAHVDGTPRSYACRECGRPYVGGKHPVYSLRELAEMPCPFPDEPEWGKGGDDA